MAISARNQLNVKITDIKSDELNSLISAKLSDKQTLNAIIASESERRLGIKVGDMALFLFKSSNVFITQNKGLLGTNQIKGVIKSIKNGVVNSEIIISVGDDEISVIATKECAAKLANHDSVFIAIKPLDIIVGVR